MPILTHDQQEERGRLITAWAKIARLEKLVDRLNYIIQIQIKENKQNITLLRANKRLHLRHTMLYYRK